MTNFSSANVIYLVSQPRSGSTLLQRILAGHPQIHTTAEPWLMLQPVYALRAHGHTAEYDAQLAVQAVQDFCATLPRGQEDYLAAVRQMALYLYGAATEAAGAVYFLDKTPRYYLILAELARIMPDARFILLFRNPLAVLDSLLRTSVKGHWQLLTRLKNDLLLAPQLLAEAIDLLGQSAKIIHYENLVSSPQGQVASLCEWLDVAYRQEMLQYGNTPSLAGSMGDRTSLRTYSRPSAELLDAWSEMARTPQTRHLAESYLAALGPDLLARLGYDHASLQRKLSAIPTGPGTIDATWAELFELSPAQENRRKYVELALLEHRRLAWWMRRLFRRS